MEAVKATLEEEYGAASNADQCAKIDALRVPMLKPILNLGRCNVSSNEAKCRELETNLARLEELTNAAKTVRALGITNCIFCQTSSCVQSAMVAGELGESPDQE